MKGFGFATIIGLVALALWIAPQTILGHAPRTDGFDPYRFGDGWPFWTNVSLRMLRIVVIVPLAEELFWRGFLLRYLVRKEFDTVPMGTFTWMSFAVTTIAFCFEHQRPDWPAAVLTGTAPAVSPRACSPMPSRISRSPSTSSPRNNGASGEAGRQPAFPKA
jgi:CAAX prenyl protease-like protein